MWLLKVTRRPRTPTSPRSLLLHLARRLRLRASLRRVHRSLTSSGPSKFSCTAQRTPFIGSFFLDLYYSRLDAFRALEEQLIFLPEFHWACMVLRGRQRNNNP